MRPLVFLFVRSFVNGIRRTFTSPKRTLGLIVFGSYYYFAVMRPFTSPASQVANLPIQGNLSMPPVGVLDGCIFGALCVISVFLLANVTTYKGSYRPADIDVLFPTPVSPKLVLVFRIVRDYLFTLIAPLILGMFAYRGTSVGFAALFRNYPTHGADILRLAWLAWMMLSLCWVSISYAVSMFVGRSDLQSDKNGKLINYGLALATFSSLGYVCYCLRSDLSWNMALSISHSPLLRIVYFPATLCTEMVINGVEGNFAMAILYFCGGAGIVVVSLALAMTQVGWLYDQAAAKGLSNDAVRAVRRSGSTYALAAMRAREGKLKRGRLSGSIAGWRLTGPAALLWKELLMQMRGTLRGTTFMAVLMAATFAGVTYGLGTQQKVFGIMLLTISGMAGYMFALTTGFAGFRELLMKVDLIKPIPVPPGMTIFWEILAKCPIPAGLLFLGCSVGVAMSPSTFGTALGAYLVGLSVLLESLGAVLLTLMLFPDYEDPTQRGLSGMVMMLSIALSILPGAGAFVFCQLVLHWSVFFCAIPAFAVAVGVTAAMAAVSGSLYSGYNPNE